MSFLLVLFFSFSYQKQQWGRSILFLSLAIYLKIMPGVFLALFLADKKFKEIFYTLALTLLLFAAGVFYFPGSFGDNLKALLTNLKMYQEIYVIGQGGFPFGHSLFGLLKAIYQHLVPVGFEDPMNIQWLSGVYFWAAVVIFAVIILYIVWGKEEFW
jgi:hypothetical protein